MQQPAPASAHAEAPTASTIAYNLAGIAVLVLLLAVGIGYGIDQLSRASKTPVPTLEDSERISQTIAGTELSIPVSWFRFGEQMKDGFTNQIDLRVVVDAGGRKLPVEVTLLPRSRARTSASLLDAVYLHQFADETLGGVAGLIGKPMLAGNGYGHESVWYDAISPNPFVAKCADPMGERQAQCVRTVYLPSGIAAVYTFDAGMLQGWRDFDAGMEHWLSAIGAW